MLMQILTIITPVLALILAGYLYARRFQPNTEWMNRMNIDMFMPALIFSAMAQRHYDGTTDLWLVIGALAIVLGSGVLAVPIGRLLRLDARTFLPSMMFNNCGNMGLPLALFAFGEKDLSNAMILFITTNLLFFTLGTWLISNHANLKNLCFSPMILSTLGGWTVGITALHLPDMLMNAFKLLGDIALPLMLVTLGIRMSEVRLADWKIGIAGAIICPLTGLLMAAVIVPTLPLTHTQQGMLYLFSVLPPAIVNYLLAEKHQQEPHKVAAIVLVGNVASLFFVPIGLALAFH